MTTVAKRLHTAFLEPLRETVVWHSPITDKPLCVDLALPNPPRLRVYLYSLVSGGIVRPNEYKAVLRVRGQQVGHYASFDHSGERLALLAAYREDLDVFVLWDASLHARFKNGGNVQVRDNTVHAAAAIGRADQRRPLASGVTEAVIACQTWNLMDAIHDRVAWTGGFETDPLREP